MDIVSTASGGKIPAKGKEMIKTGLLYSPGEAAAFLPA
jgi:hypothetical protein